MNYRPMTYGKMTKATTLANATKCNRLRQICTIGFTKSYKMAVFAHFFSFSWPMLQIYPKIVYIFAVEETSIRTCDP